MGVDQANSAEVPPRAAGTEETLLGRRTRLLLVAALLGLASGAAAPSAAAQEQSKQADAAKDGVRRDPKGKTGISPMWEAIKLGDAAYLARDWEEAVNQYRNAVKANREDPVVYTRLAGALRAKGEFAEAASVLETGLRFANTVTERGRILFMLADIKEREGQLEAALKEWKQYQSIASGNAKDELKGATLYPASADERVKQVSAAIQRAKDYALVKERIQKREAELEPKAKGSKK